MNEKIPIDDNMPESLKNAISYLNEKNISLTDKIDVNFETEPEEEDDGFNGYISDEDINDSDVEDEVEDEIVEDEVDISDLNNMF